MRLKSRSFRIFRRDNWLGRIGEALQQHAAAGLLLERQGCAFIYDVGLGAADVLATGLVGKISCARNSKRSRTLIRVYGGREIAQGIATLSSMPRPAGWVWGRVAGDALDIGSVARGLSIVSLTGWLTVTISLKIPWPNYAPSTGNIQRG